MNDIRLPSAATPLCVMVWIDHHEARVFHYDREFERSAPIIIRAERSPVHLHHKANTRGSGHVPVNHEYLERVAIAIADAAMVLVTGPAGAKHELITHIADRHPELAGRIVGVHTLDHPGDGELLNIARQFFPWAERMAQLGVKDPGPV